MYLYRTHRRILISWGVANHVNIIELKHIDENPSNDNHSTDGFEKTMVVIAFYVAFRTIFVGATAPGTNTHNALVTINSATFIPPESKRALPAMICFAEDENVSVVSSGALFAVPASSPLDELVAPYELRAGSFLSNGLRRWWDIEQAGSVWF